jgi:sn-glycerol 3-phosphate transport system ATP-binding protein
MTTTTDNAAVSASVTLDGVGRRFDTATALSDISLTFEPRRFTALLGPSGCGKSTLLRLVAGLDRPTSGRVLIGGRDVTDAPPVARDLSMVFQSYALFPHLSVRDNILFGLSVRRVPRAEQNTRLARVAGMMGLDTLLARKPSQLSGGQQQRVALARAVISERPICLMDEPLSNLDAKLRAEMRLELRTLQQRLGLTVIYVTHDQVEAMTMADQIVLLNAGRMEQAGTPEDIYRHPATTFVARFIGTPPMNLIPADTLRGAGAVLPDAARDTLVGLRPEEITLSPAGVPADLDSIEYLGADLLVTARIGPDQIVIRRPAHLPRPTGRLYLSWPADALHLFAADSGRRIAFTPAPQPAVSLFNQAERTAP